MAVVEMHDQVFSASRDAAYLPATQPGNLVADRPAQPGLAQDNRVDALSANVGFDGSDRPVG
jgi:hypothetical protein